MDQIWDKLVDAFPGFVNRIFYFYIKPLKMIREISKNVVKSEILSTKNISGLTHCFYNYPARFSPKFANTIIRQFSKPGDVVLDPFMGGGTTIVEAMALGRRAIGIDINSP